MIFSPYTQLVLQALSSGATLEHATAAADVQRVWEGRPKTRNTAGPAYIMFVSLVCTLVAAWIHVFVGKRGEDQIEYAGFQLDVSLGAFLCVLAFIVALFAFRTTVTPRRFQTRRPRSRVERALFAAAAAAAGWTPGQAAEQLTLTSVTSWRDLSNRVGLIEHPEIEGEAPDRTLARSARIEALGGRVDRPAFVLYVAAALLPTGVGLCALEVYSALAPAAGAFS